MNLLGRPHKTPAARAPNILIRVSLDEPSVNFNFAALAEEKYGWDALHPVAARLRAIHGDDSEDESDSEAPTHTAYENAPVGSGRELTTATATAADASDNHTTTQKKKRKRRKDLEYYDVEDPFIDDDELVLQERTAVSKDGFFVFQGPLVAEGETVRIEKADGTQKRGGGKGSRGGKSIKGRASMASKPVRTKSTTAPTQDKDTPMIDSPVKEIDSPPKLLPTTQVVPSVIVPPLEQPPPPTFESTKDTQEQTNAMEIDVPSIAQTAPTVKPDHLVDAPVVAPATPAAVTNNNTTTTSTKRMTPAASTLKRAEKSSAKANPSAKAMTTATAPTTSHASPTVPASPSLNPDGSLKKPRKPAREKTTEEKAILARRAREARERKKLEKRAQEEVILARAFANPAIDTSGITFPRLSEGQTPEPHGGTTLSGVTLGVPVQDVGNKARAATIARDTASPSGRSMNVDALLD